MYSRGGVHVQTIQSPKSAHAPNAFFQDLLLPLSEPASDLPSAVLEHHSCGSLRILDRLMTYVRPARST